MRAFCRACAGRAADIVQETYLAAWKSFGKYERSTNCRAWLFRILLNLVRRERRNWFKWITDAEMDVASSPLPALEPIASWLTDEDILAALDELPPEHREVILLVDVEEFLYREASEILGIPLGTVMSRLSRGRAILRQKLCGVAGWGGAKAAAV